MFWAHSGLGVVTLPDFWPTLHSKRLTIVRDEIQTIKEHNLYLKSGASMAADYAVMCTGWGDHFGMFDDEHRAKVGLPVYTGKDLYAVSELPAESSDFVDWAAYDAEAEKQVDKKLPFLARPPGLKQSADLLDARRQKKWRLYRRAIPVELAARGDRSLAILGQIHTVQTPLVSEVQSLWAILYLLGEIDVPDVPAMAKEVALWNAWTRKRYLNQGQKFPYSLYDFLPVS